MSVVSEKPVEGNAYVECEIKIVLKRKFNRMCLFKKKISKKIICVFLALIMIIVLGVIVFILCGFEHCIANMYYFSVANIWNLNTLLYLLIMILGNSLGGMLIPLCNKVIKKG